VWAQTDEWWRGGVVYHVYVRSFADSNGDGVGDLQGVVDRLDYLQWLGVRGLWLSPVTASADRDWGYDVTDYRSIHPALGDLDAFDRLIAEAGRRQMGVLLDIVPNHTSDQHPWFVEARSSRSARRRDWYVWADSRGEGRAPNNWLSGFGGPAWTPDRQTGQWYLHNFLPEQPDLNWWNQEVRDEFEGILRFWLDRGVAGFRIDVAHGLVKDRALRDNPPATETDHPTVRRIGQRPVFNMNRPEVHEVWRRWRLIADEYRPQRLLVGETWVFRLDQLAAYYGGGTDELNLAFNIPFALSDFDAARLGPIVGATEAALPADSWPAWFGSNHDVGRFPTRWCAEDESRIRCALVVLLTLRGTAFVYYGDEIGMPDVAVPPERLRDPVGIRTPGHPGRDPGRTPMQWHAGPGAGFTGRETEPWLPLGDAEDCNVEAQEADARSVLHLARDLIRLRSSTPLGTGRYRARSRDGGLWVWDRGDGLTVAANLSPHDGEVRAVEQEVLITTTREGEGRRVRGSVRVGPWEAVVLGPA
jgi:alpha-glucosidase